MNIRMHRLSLSCTALSFLTVSCATTHRPCSQGGDISWDPPLKGDSKCVQKKMTDGRWYNHGRFVLLNGDGKAVLEGDFEEGQKSGIWTQFDDQGKAIREKYFEKGLEKSPPSATPSPSPSRRYLSAPGGR